MPALSDHAPPDALPPAPTAGPATPPNEPPPPVPPDRLRWLVPPAGLALATAASLLCLRLAGPAHGVLFGACAIVALLVPTLAAAAPGPAVALATAVATAAGALVGPAAALRAGDLNAPTFLPAAAAVPALALAAAGLTLLLLALATRVAAVAFAALALGLLAGGAAAAVAEVAWSSRPVWVAVLVAAATAAGTLAVARTSPSAAAWLVTLLLLGWLAWPVWLSPWLPGRDALVARLSAAHPPLALDAALTAQGVPPWTEHRVMYGRLSVLQQHVAASPPEGVRAAVLLHLSLAVPGFAAAAVRWRRRRRRRRRTAVAL